MKSERFVAGQLWIERTKQREGPPYVYTCWSGKTSKLFTDRKALLKFVKWPPKTPTGDCLRQWLLSFEQEPVVVGLKADDKSTDVKGCV
ncbi:MAG: hypothetical protein CMQ57_03370 [Gammaproteobacteria bacterium]|nr:hypothetical protein [Gammaproteobacteria bacterium]|tara:strand:+ start:2057 stop:2323 length:267 start_codon:yes stop_codon:yes gene_type:complete